MSNPIGSFFGKLWSNFIGLFKKAAPIGVAIASAVNYIAPFVEAVIAVVDPALATVVDPIINKITVGLAALKTVAADATTPEGKANVLSILQSLTTNAQALEAAFQVKDEATQQKITALVNLINSEAQAIGAQMAGA